MDWEIQQQVVVLVYCYVLFDFGCVDVGWKVQWFDLEFCWVVGCDLGYQQVVVVVGVVYQLVFVVDWYLWIIFGVDQDEGVVDLIVGEYGVVYLYQ